MAERCSAAARDKRGITKPAFLKELLLTSFELGELSATDAFLPDDQAAAMYRIFQDLVPADLRRDPEASAALALVVSSPPEAAGISSRFVVCSDDMVPAAEGWSVVTGLLIDPAVLAAGASEAGRAPAVEPVLGAGIEPAMPETEAASGSDGSPASAALAETANLVVSAPNDEPDWAGAVVLVAAGNQVSADELVAAVERAASAGARAAVVATDSELEGLPFDKLPVLPLPLFAVGADHGQVLIGLSGRNGETIADQVRASDIPDTREALVAAAEADLLSHGYEAVEVKEVLARHAHNPDAAIADLSRFWSTWEHYYARGGGGDDDAAAQADSVTSSSTTVASVSPTVAVNDGQPEAGDDDGGSGRVCEDAPEGPAVSPSEPATTGPGGGPGGIASVANHDSNRDVEGGLDESGGFGLRLPIDLIQGGTESAMRSGKRLGGAGGSRSGENDPSTPARDGANGSTAVGNGGSSDRRGARGGDAELSNASGSASGADSCSSSSSSRSSSDSGGSRHTELRGISELTTYVAAGRALRRNEALSSDDMLWPARPDKAASTQREILLLKASLATLYERDAVRTLCSLASEQTRLSALGSPEQVLSFVRLFFDGEFTQTPDRDVFLKTFEAAVTELWGSGGSTDEAAAFAEAILVQATGALLRHNALCERRLRMADRRKQKKRPIVERDSPFAITRESRHPLKGSKNKDKIRHLSLPDTDHIFVTVDPRTCVELSFFLDEGCRRLWHRVMPGQLFSFSIPSGDVWYKWAVLPGQQVAERWGYKFEFYAMDVSLYDVSLRVSASIDWVCWLVELLLLDDTPGSDLGLARPVPSVYTREMFGLLVDALPVVVGPKSTRLVRLLGRILDRCDLFPPGEAPDLLRLRPLYRKMLEDRTPQRNAPIFSMHMQALFDLFLSVRRAAAALGVRDPTLKDAMATDEQPLAPIKLRLVSDKGKVKDFSFHSTTVFDTVMGTTPPLTAGRWYYEVRLLSTNKMLLGWATPDFCTRSGDKHGAGYDAHSWAFDGKFHKLWHNRTSRLWNDRDPSWAKNDIVGVMVDMDEGVPCVPYVCRVPCVCA